MAENFRGAKWFLDKISNWGEGPRLDFKSEVHKIDSVDKQIQFARHLIAFANVARRIGEPCWMIFGVFAEKDQRGFRKFQSVKDQYPLKPPKGWDSPHAHINELQIDGVEKVYGEFAIKWIEPIPDFSLEFGEVDGQFVSYIEIKPKYQEPFSLKQDVVDSKGKIYKKGSVYIRRWSASVLVDPSQYQDLVPLNKAAYLSQTDWRNLVLPLRDEKGKFAEAFHLSLSLPLNVKGEKQSVADVIVGRLDDNFRFIVLSGAAGQGKTTILHSVAHILANRANIEFIAHRDSFGDSVDDSENPVLSVADELEVIASIKISLFMDLRAAFESTDDFEERLLVIVRGLLPNIEIESIWNLFRIPGSRWVLILDGLDEAQNWEDFSGYLQAWIEKLPKNVQVVLSSRPYAISGFVGEMVEIAPLTVEQALSLVRKSLRLYIADNPTLDLQENIYWLEIGKWLGQNAAFFSFLDRPRSVYGFIKAFLNVNAPKPELDKTQIDLSQKISYFQNVLGIPKTVGGISANELINEDEYRKPSQRSFSLVRSKAIRNYARKRFPLKIKARARSHEVPVLIRADTISMPSLGVAIREMILYMWSEEVNRRKGRLGSSGEEVLDRSRREIEKTAWYWHWNNLDFDFEICKEKQWLTEESRQWNGYMGFIRKKDIRMYQFVTQLFQFFCAADSGYSYAEYDESEVKKHLQSRMPISYEVLNLLNQLRQANGRNPISFDGG